MGIPSNVTVGLAVDAVAYTVPNALFQAAAGTLSAFLCGSIDGGAVIGKGKDVDQPVLYRAAEEKSITLNQKVYPG